MKAIVIGNCQSVTFKNLAERMVPNIRFDQYEAHNINENFNSIIEGYDIVFAQPHIYSKISTPDHNKTKLIKFPRCSFAGLHPDLMYLTHNGQKVVTVLSLHSAIIFAAWRYGLSEDETVGLFNRGTYRALEFQSYFDGTKLALKNEWEDCGLNVLPHFDRWMSKGEPFMLTINHPIMEVMVDCTRETLRAANFQPIDHIDLPHHHLEDLAVSSVYPEYAEDLGLRGSSVSKAIWRGQEISIDIPRYVSDSFSRYKVYDAAGFDICKADRPHYKRFFENYEKNKTKPSRRVENPYIGLPSYQNWRRSFRNMPTADIDPVVSCDFKITTSDRVATAGSCFAQHLARALKVSGLNYYAPEQGAEEKGYGLFSARYGNIYTPAQLNQLIDRAYNHFHPHDSMWIGSKGVQIDPFRPEVDIDGSIEEDRTIHLNYVREVIEKSDYFVFTLGLTEAWRSKVDGAIFPLAPGVAGGSMDDSRYEFVNFDEIDTYRHLESAIRKMRVLNQNLKVILTVSPVPLMATFEKRHVLVSTTYSKSVLRVACEKATRNIKNVHYFPSYEIITGSYNKGEYFDEDLRGVRMAGVNHVMKLFIGHGTDVKVSDVEATLDMERNMDVFCAEEMLDETNVSNGVIFKSE